MILIQKQTRATHLKVLFSKHARGQNIKNNFFFLQHISSTNLLHSKTFKFEIKNVFSAFWCFLDFLKNVLFLLF